MKELNRSLFQKTAAEIFCFFLLSTSFAFTFKQKQWFKRRDPECLLKGKDRIVCSKPEHDEIDHCTPQGIAYERIGLTENQTDSAINGGRLCRNHHRGHPQSKHPDAHLAQWEYKESKVNGNGDTFEHLKGERHKLLQDGQEYWNDQHGAYLAAEIRRRTIEYVLKNPDDPFPQKNGNGNGKKNHYENNGNGNH